MDTLCTVDKMVRRINMRRGVHAHRDLRDVGGRSLADRFERRDLNARVTFVDRRLGTYRYGNIVDFHQCRIIDNPLDDKTSSLSDLLCDLCFYVVRFPTLRSSRLCVKLS